MKKVIREGKVAVLVSYGYGAGWYSWNPEYKEILFHPKLVELVEQKRTSEITEEFMMENLGINMYPCGVSGLSIVWVKEGTAFEIDEYDGAESLKTLNDLTLVA